MTRSRLPLGVLCKLLPPGVLSNPDPQFLERAVTSGVLPMLSLLLCPLSPGHFLCTFQTAPFSRQLSHPDWLGEVPSRSFVFRSSYSIAIAWFLLRPQNTRQPAQGLAAGCPVCACGQNCWGSGCVSSERGTWMCTAQFEAWLLGHTVTPINNMREVTGAGVPRRDCPPSLSNLADSVAFPFLL